MKETAIVVEFIILHKQAINTTFCRANKNEKHVANSMRAEDIDGHKNIDIEEILQVGFVRTLDRYGLNINLKSSLEHGRDS